MQRGLITLGLLLIAIGEVLMADTACFHCIYSRNDKEKYGHDCQWPKSDDTGDINAWSIGCGDPDSHCSKLYYEDKTAKIKYIARSCLSKALCDSSDESLKYIKSLGVTGTRVCCQGKNCNSGNTNSAGVIVVTILALLAFSMGNMVRRV